MDIKCWVRDGAEACENSGKVPWWRPQRWGADAPTAPRRGSRAIEAHVPAMIVEQFTTFMLS
jgi:hypothetical protein